MKILVDTSVLVDVDRGVKETVDLLKMLAGHNIELVISPVTVSEILTGSYLAANTKTSIQSAKEILNQFVWLPLDGTVAEQAAQLLAYVFAHKKEIEYQDAAIAATFLVSRSDYLLTLNKKDFVLFPIIAGKVYTPTEFRKTVKF